MKRGASKRMMLLIAGVGAILLLVTLGYMLANHREGNNSKLGQKKTATKATTAEKLDPKIVLLIQDLQISSKRLHEESSRYLRNQNPTKDDMQSYVSHFGAGFEGGAECPNLSAMKFNYVYKGMTTCNVIKPSEYNGQGTATNEKTGEIIPITKQMLIDALAQVK